MCTKKDLTIEQIAAWVTVVTAPITILTTIGSLTIRIYRLPKAAYEDTATVGAVAIFLIAAAWCFFFIAQLHVFASLSRKFSELAAFGASALTGFVFLVFFCAVEVLILDTLVPKTSIQHIAMLLWLAVPVITWILADCIAVPLVVSGMHEKDTES